MEPLATFPVDMCIVSVVGAENGVRMIQGTG